MQLPQDYFQTNLALLQRNHPLAWQAVTDYTGPLPGELCLAADGKPNLFFLDKDGERVYFHEPNNTDAELANYYAVVPEDATGIALFVGMGLGYTPRAMIQSHRQLRHLGVFEPEVGLFIRALQALDLSPLLSDERVIIALGEDINVPAVLAPMNRAMQLENLHFLQHLPCFRFSPDLYQKLHDAVYKHGNTFSISGNTTAVCGGKFISNRLRNLSAIHHQKLLEHLRGVFTGIPAILVAAGPSLDKNIHLLHQAKGHALIFAVDTALPALLAQGVTPDFTSCIDMDDITFEKISDVAAEATETSLICSTWVTTLIPKNIPARQVYWAFATITMEAWLNDLLGGQVLTEGAGTVAQLNFNAAILLGCSPIIFVGQDLAFTDHAVHAHHTSLTSKDHDEHVFGGQDLLWVDGYGGNKVLTYRPFLAFKHHFEQSMAANRDRKFINATEGGVRLVGTEELTLQEVLRHYCSQERDIMSMIRKAEGRGVMSDRRPMIKEFSRTLKEITDIEADMHALKSIVESQNKEIHRLQKQKTRCLSFNDLPRPMQRQLTRLDTINAKLDNARLWPLLTEVTMEGLRQSERLNHDVRQLTGQPEQYLHYLAKSIQRFALINQYRFQVLVSFRQQLKGLHSHLQHEHLLLQRLNNRKKKNETVHQLLRLYAASGDHIVLEKMLAEHCLDQTDSSEVSFLLGTIAAHRGRLEEMERQFSLASGLDPSLSRRIDECSTMLAHRYIGFAHHYANIDRRVMHRMLFKASRYVTVHQPLQELLAEEATKILADNPPPSEAPIIPEQLSVWCHELTHNANLISLLGTAQATALHQYHGDLLLAHERNGEAIEAFTAALKLTPQEAAIHFSLANASFANHDFALTVHSLDQAVGLDRQYARYWETIGDNLRCADLLADAIKSYEKCFLAMPEAVGLLKKIGDCYLAMDQLEAAREAYRIYQDKIGGNEAKTIKGC